MILHGTLSSSPHLHPFSSSFIKKLGDVVYIELADVKIIKFKLDT